MLSSANGCAYSFVNSHAVRDANASMRRSDNAHMKLDKTRLRAEAWRTPGVLWRPARGEALRPLTDDDVARLAPLLDRSTR